MNNKYEMIAKTFQGLEGVLADELKEIGAEDIQPGRRMVSFMGDLEMMYKANFALRTALRVLKPIYQFKATDADGLYEAVKTFEWDNVLSIDQTFSIDSTVYSEEFRHSKFVTYRVKDAIADYFSEKFGKRPSIRINNADIMFNVHISDDNVTLSLDSSGESLHRRGYRVAQTEAPINEVLAAGLLKLSGWKGDCNLIDPMCGSGTFLIEAALIGANINPGVFRSNFAFERWPDFDQDLFDSIYNDDSTERPFEYKIYGSDISPKAIDIATQNVKNAGVSKYINLQVKPFQSIESAPENGMLITNPPYGERLAVEDMELLYKQIGDKLKKVFRGYNAWVIGYKNEFFDQIGLKPSLKYPILNGALECELREYVIFDGKFNDFRKDGGSVKNDEFRRSDKPVRRTRFDDDKLPRFGGNKDEEKPRSGKYSHREEPERPKNALEEKYHKSFDKKPGREFENGKSKYGDRPPRREFGDRPPRRDDGAPRREHGDRPPRREFGDRPPRRDDGAPRREHGDRPPRREFGDRPPRRDDGAPRREYSPRDDSRGASEGRNSFKRDRINYEEKEQIHGEALAEKMIKFRKPTLSANDERPIIKGRRNSWKRAGKDKGHSSSATHRKEKKED